VGAVVNTRGKRNSNDENNPFEHESQDLYEVIDWVSKQPWSNGKVGMIGGSYVGFSQWAAVKNLHPALKTIVPQVSVGIGIDYPAQNNVFMSYMLQWIQYVTNNKL
jgi:putative CocE/NonD family hydrolase